MMPPLLLHLLMWLMIVLTQNSVHLWRMTFEVDRILSLSRCVKSADYDYPRFVNQLTIVLEEQVLSSVRQLRAPISSRLSQFISAKGQHHQQQAHQQQGSIAATSSKNSEHVDTSSILQPEQESVALALCQKHHERLRMLFGSADAGEIVAEAAAVVLLKDFCAGHGIASPPSSAFVQLFRKYEPQPVTNGTVKFCFTCRVASSDHLTVRRRHGAAPGGVNWYKAIEFICSGRSADIVHPAVFVPGMP